MTSLLIAFVLLIGCPKREWDNPFDPRGSGYIPPPQVTRLILSLVEPDTLWANYWFGSALPDTYPIEHAWLYEQEMFLRDTIDVPEGYAAYGTYIRISEGPGTYGLELYYAGAFLGRDTIEVGGWMLPSLELPVR